MGHAGVAIDLQLFRPRENWWRGSSQNRQQTKGGSKELSGWSNLGMTLYLEMWKGHHRRVVAFVVGLIGSLIARGQRRRGSDHRGASYAVALI